MTKHPRLGRPLRAAGIRLLACFAMGVAAFAETPAPNFSLPAAANTADLENARLFAEPLVPVGGVPSAAENAALAAALKAYAPSRDVKALEDFVAGNASSPWLVSVLTNLGLLEFQEGYFSKAMAAWARAWTLGKASADPAAQPIVNRAVAELIKLDDRVGRVAESQALLAEAGNRSFSGMTANMIRDARQAVGTMQFHPAEAFKCGPFAVSNILAFLHKDTAASAATIKSYATTPQGTSLGQVLALANQVGLHMQAAKRLSGRELPLPAVVNWKLNHYGALLRQDGNRYLLEDPTFGTSEWVLEDAVRQESTGYFLIPAGPLPAGWAAVDSKEAETVWGRGDGRLKNGSCTTPADPTSGGGGDGGGGKKPNKPPPGKGPCGGMATWTIHTMLCSLNVMDRPLFYQPPVGPQIAFDVNYDAMEENQPSTIQYSNIGPLWNFGWLSSITFDSNNAYLANGGGGTEIYTQTGSNPVTYYQDTETSANLVVISPTHYERQSMDGSKWVFAAADASGRLYLTQMVDAQGNAVTMKYDSNFRLVSITDAAGQVTTLAYGSNTLGAALFYNIAKVTDPFGRSASFAYNASGELSAITDMLGMTSQFAYGANGFIQTLTTPYGATNFALTETTTQANGNVTSLVVTEPNGAQQRLDAVEISTVTPDTEPVVPAGMPVSNQYLEFRNSYFWSRKAMHDAPGDYTQATLTHFLHLLSGAVESGIIESTKAPLENRVWYFYQNEDASTPLYTVEGMLSNPTYVGRVLDDGTTQLVRKNYNALGQCTQTIDPLGRTTNYVYASNGIDLLNIQQVHGAGSDVTATYTWNNQHCPLTYTGADGETSTFTYNAQGLQLTNTDPKNETTTATYNSQGYLTSVQGPMAGSLDKLTFTYDALGRMQSTTDGDGYTLTFAYDALNRPTSTTYPDGTTEQTVYTNLLPTKKIDRLGRATTYAYNSLQQMVSMTDPLGRVTQYIRCNCGEVLKLIDPLGQTTSWTYDIEGRGASKTYPDGSTLTYAYDSASSRLASITDARKQTKNFSYNADDSIYAISYQNAQAETPSVTYAYDPNYPRMVSMSDGIGKTTYAYYPVTGSPSPGANQLETVSGPWNNSGVTYAYDSLGRVISRSINGVAQTMVYDVLDRYSTVTNALGTFHYAYENGASRITGVTFPNGQTKSISYFGNSGDWRLKQIKNLNANASNLSEFDYTSNAAGNIGTWEQATDANAGVTSTLSYDAADQLSGSSASGSTFGYTYDAGGNRLTQTINGSTSTASYDALNQLQQVSPALGNDKTYTWDAENRLVAINYTGTSLSTLLRYDGLNRCAQIVEMNGSSITSTKRFVWCDSQQCEEHDANDNVTRRFFDQGEQISGTNYFYTADHLGSIREMTDSAGAIHARYSYDPYGTRTKVSGDLDASRGFTGYYYHAPSGLQLAAFRAYDSQTGRWLSRDPLPDAERSQGANLYEYVANNPVKNIDLVGEDRTLYFFGHAWIVVDTWDDCCQNKTGSKMLDFAPMLGTGSDFRTNDPSANPYPTFMHWTLSSTCQQDNALLGAWKDLSQTLPNLYNVWPYNCWSISLTFFNYGM